MKTMQFKYVGEALILAIGLFLAGGAISKGIVKFKEMDRTVTAADNAVIWPGEGGKDGCAVYGCLFLGKGAYGTVDLSEGTEVIVKPRGSSGTADPLDQETVHQHQEGGDRGLGKHRGIQANRYEKHGKKDDRRRYPEVIHKKMKIDLRRQGDDHADRQRRPPAPEYLGRNHHILRRFAAPFRYVLPSNEHNCSAPTPRKALLREMRGSGRLRLLTRLMLNS